MSIGVGFALREWAGGTRRGPEWNRRCWLGGGGGGMYGGVVSRGKRRVSTTNDLGNQVCRGHGVAMLAESLGNTLFLLNPGCAKNAGGGTMG